MRLAFVLGLLGLVACGTAPGAHGVEHVVLISCDTLRADALGAYVGSGPDRLKEWGAPAAAERTPNLDRLAREAVLFERAIVAAPSTLASHTSLFSGRWPNMHGVARNGFEVRPELELLAERFAARGFATAGFAGSFALDRRFGIAQGFAHWDQEFDMLVDGKSHEQNERRAEKVTDAALGWLDATHADAAPRFLFVHYFDAHAAYDPPGRAPERVEGREVSGSMEDLRTAVARQQSAFGDARGLDATILSGLDASWLGHTPEVGELDRALVARYAGEVQYLDGEIERLLSGLEARGILRDALVIVTADHGETLLDHCDVYNHGLALYQSTVHVPLLVRLPDGVGAARRVATTVSNVDVLPTLLALCDLPVGAPFDGVSLLAALEGRPFTRGPVFSSATQPPSAEVQGAWLNLSKAHSVQTDAFQWIESPYLGRSEFYDLTADPRQTRDLSAGSQAEIGPAAHAARAELAAALDAWRRTSRPLPSGFDRSQVEEVERRLRELGYTGR